MLLIVSTQKRCASGWRVRSPYYSTTTTFLKRYTERYILRTKPQRPHPFGLFFLRVLIGGKTPNIGETELGTTNDPRRNRAGGPVAKTAIQSTNGVRQALSAHLPLRRTRWLGAQTLLWRKGRSKNVRMCGTGPRARENSPGSSRNPERFPGAYGRPCLIGGKINKACCPTRPHGAAETGNHG